MNTNRTPPGDQTLTDWHARFARAVRRWFLDRSGGRHDAADDLSQRTWAALTATLARGGYDPSRSAPSTFVYAVMHNTWRQHAAALARDARAPALAPDAPLPGESDPTDAAALAELVEQVRSLLTDPDRLEPDTRHVLGLIASGVSDRALAERLGVSPSTAHDRKRAALQQMRLALSEISQTAESPRARHARPGTTSQGPNEPL